MASGDKCYFQKDVAGQATGYVVHVDCDEHGDNTITSIATGEVVRYRPKSYA